MNNFCQLKPCNSYADFEMTYNVGPDDDPQILKMCKNCFTKDSNEEFRMFVIEKKLILSNPPPKTKTGTAS